MRKETRKYWFTVEGQNEKWYLNWLEKTINKNENSNYNVILVSQVQQQPLKFSKTVNPRATPEVTHWCDYESNEPVHVKKFMDILEQLDQSTGLGGRRFKYRLGYSNFTFELWMILHKDDFCERLENRFEYLEPINRVYNEHYAKLNTYKCERNFKRILSSLTLEDVISAIERSKEIMSRNLKENTAQVHGGYTFYIQNPSLTIWESVEKILKQCGLMPARMSV